MGDNDRSTVGDVVEGILKHYGVKGMRWGVTTKDHAAKTASKAAAKEAKLAPKDITVTQPKPGKFAKSHGGGQHPLHPDSEKALVARRKAKASTTDALSNVELKSAVERMQLEQKFNQLEFQSDRRSKGQRFVMGLFGHRKPTKFVDTQEEHGRQTGDAVKKAIAARAAMKAAQAAAAAA
jgi:hypothetical protein